MEGLLRVFGRPEFPGAVERHVELSAAALLVAVAISVPLALLVNRSPLASLVVINIGNIGRAVPSLALLALAMPFLGFGFAPSLLALAALGIPPILINATTGLREVSREVVDAARGMGLSNLQILTHIQLPIAAPVIFAGVRTSAVQIVASATLATFIGGGGLGDIIVEGFQLSSTPVLLAGALTVAALAIVTEVIFGVLERVFTPEGLKVAGKRQARD
ncbi:ABC transporter permease [Rubrobacter calidifluminis]|uniref:ABC transporter permease n=1 Tax=Rubrobacter calidifluminis TaxID=1392640 RepID=UPI002362CEC0|nr:ABC transporter permease [Rubrobacter calidifluminis]